ncbi:MAG: polysaccharide pyruvyl transferase family protein [Fimbriimonadaceae bacterium]|nr:polysaccharide pyruvyl transferase family protein [Fimbriimonadaceae bacterium]
MNRQHFLQTTLAAALTAAVGAQTRRPRLLLRSSWQTANIGDIAHTPGVLHLLEQHLPEVEVRLWPSKVDNGVDALLRRRFPQVPIVQSTAEVAAALAECDFLLHGSGPSLVAQKDVARWAQETGKPYGVYGITVGGLNDATVAVLNGARFVFYRDTVSLAHAKERGCTCPVQEFGPDGAFATDLADDAAADAFLAAHGLQPGQFLCCINRFRLTPYWLVKPNVAYDAAKDARNQAKKEADSAPLLDAICRVVRQTDLRVLLCPEDATQMAINKEMLYDRLPTDVQPRVVWREQYWLTAEALSTYRRSAGLFGHEMHSPIMAIGQGLPAIVCRWAEQTSKGFMWRDIGLGDWLFDLDQPAEAARVADAVLAMAQDLPAARAKAAAAREVVLRRQRETMAIVGQQLASTSHH